MANEVVTLESIAQQLTSLRDENAAFRVDVLEHFARDMRSLFSLEGECQTIKSAIGRLDSRVAGGSGARADEELVKELSELRTRINQLEAQLERRA